MLGFIYHDSSFWIASELFILLIESAKFESLLPGAAKQHNPLRVNTDMRHSIRT